MSVLSSISHLESTWYNSGGLYGIEQRSAAISCKYWASECVRTLTRATSTEPKSMMTGKISSRSSTLCGLISLWAKGPPRSSDSCKCWIASQICKNKINAVCSEKWFCVFSLLDNSSASVPLWKRMLTGVIFALATADNRARWPQNNNKTYGKIW